MTSLRSPFSALLMMVFVGSCSDTRPRLFEDSATTPDAISPMCTTNAQCDDNVACTTDVCVVGGLCEHIASGPMCMPAQRCMRVSDCDDRIACTRDTCLVDGTCGHTAQNDMCPTGQTCDLVRGCNGGAMGSCRTDMDCADMFACTVDTCGADGRCTYTAQNSRCTSPQVCRAGMGCINERACSSDENCDDRLRCNGTERCVEFGCTAGTAVTCDDMNPCTMDRCNETGAMCSNTTNPSCMGSVRSGVFSVAVPAMYTCGLGQVNVEIRQFLFSVSGTSLSVTPSPRGPGMMGTITGSTFMVRAVVGDPANPTKCIETYSLSGMFTDANHFTGTYTASFSPALFCGIVGCSVASFPIAGTAAM
jgi:hypothetical protein